MMTDCSTRSPNAQAESKEDEKKENRTCDFCGDCIALLYCRADSAKLCFSCDREVHSTNPLFTKHTRWQLCDSCDSKPATIVCATENSVLCQNCDWESHGQSLPSLHERRPLEGFTGRPTVSELLGLVGFEDVGKKALSAGDNGGGDDLLDLLVWDTPSIVTLDDLIVSNSSKHSFQAMGVPPLPKNHKVACGKYKEEILAQLREMAKSDPNLNDRDEDMESLLWFQSVAPEQDLQPRSIYAGFEHGTELNTAPPYEMQAGSFWSDENAELPRDVPSTLFGSCIEENYLVPDKDSDIGGGSASQAKCSHEGHHPVTETPEVPPKLAVRELTSQERESAISRYKEKKKTRRYEKHIRYESRRIRAENRTRIKGRFAKMDC